MGSGTDLQMSVGGIGFLFRQSEVNFVPSDLFVGHGFSLESMHLVAGHDKPTMKLDISLEPEKCIS